MSDIGLTLMIYLLVAFGMRFGGPTLLKLYFLPWMACHLIFALVPVIITLPMQWANHCQSPSIFASALCSRATQGIVALTYLHHSDPTIPHYRKAEWNFLRGALSTVDRPLLGWAGRFFLKNVSHDHVCPRSISITRTALLTARQIAHHLFSSIPFCTSILRSLSQS